MEREKKNRVMSDATPILAAMSLLDQAGIYYQRLDDDQVVAGNFILHAQSGYWHARLGNRRGYTVRELITEIKRAAR